MSRGSGRVILLLLLVASYSCLFAFGEDGPRFAAVQLSTSGAFCHACPIDASVALTALHCVAIENPLDLRRTFKLGTWSMGNHNGSFKPISYDQRRDLALISSTTPFPAWNKLAAKDPEVGDRIGVFGYDWDKAMKVRLLWGTIKNLLAGNIFYDRNPGPGSSGGCVFAMDGSVVGIHYGFVRGDDKDSKETGLANLVTPGWFPISDPWGVVLTWERE